MIFDGKSWKFSEHGILCWDGLAMALELTAHFRGWELSWEGGWGGI